MSNYDYNLIADFNVNIRVERLRVITTGIGKPIKLRDIPYSQVRLDKSDMEDILEHANSVAENTVLYYKNDSGRETLTAEQLDEVRPAINEAIATLSDNLTNEDWMAQHVKVLHKADPNDRTTGLNSYIHTIEDGEYETKVYLT